MADMRKWRAGAIALAAIGAIAAPALAFAHSGQPPAAPSGIAATAASGTARVGGSLGIGLGEDGHRGPRVDLDALAAELGVTTEALTTAIESVRSSIERPERGADMSAYRAAVVNALASALGLDAATVEAAVGDAGFPFGGHGPRDGARLETLATTLGVTTEALQAAIETANSSVDRPSAGSDLAAYRAAFAASIAATLGLDPASVAAAIGDAVPFGGHGPRDGARFEALATTLGVTTDALKAAMQQVRTDLAPPDAATDRDAYRAQYVAALAQALGIDAATVDTAIGEDPMPFGGRGLRGRHGFRGGAHGGAGAGAGSGNAVFGVRALAGQPA